MDRGKHPEINTAQIIINKLRLEHPIDIFSVGNNIAKIHEKSLPNGIDGFVIFGSNNKHDIYINSINSKPRQAFTVAHEIGHIFIPWHPCKSIPCNITIPDKFHHALEAEANRFASEMLMPSTWITSLVTTSGTKHTLETLLSNNISIEAACIAIQKCTLAPTIIEVSYKSRSAIKRYPSAGCPPDYKQLPTEDIPENHLSLRTELSLEFASIRIVTLKQPDYDGIKHIDLSSREIFDVMYSQRDIMEAKCHWASANGIISALNGQRKHNSPKELFRDSVLRICVRTDMSFLSTHELFTHFVAQRCKELFVNRPRT